MPISRRKNFAKPAIGIRRAWFFAQQKPSDSEPAVARAEGIALKIILQKTKTLAPKTYFNQKTKLR